MGAELAASLPAARDLFDRAKEILGYDLLELCTAGPEEKLNSTVHSQPALFVCSLAALEKLKAEDAALVATCDVAAGLSLGEYTALVFAGAIEFEAGLRLVQTRGQAMQEAADGSTGGMVSILGLEVQQIRKLCDEAADGGVLQVANLLCPGNIVVSGDLTACQRITPLAEQAGAMRVIPLAVAGAFHTPLMQPAVGRLEAALAETEISRPRIPVVSNVDARPHDQPEEIRHHLVKQVVDTVLWEDSIRWLIDEFGIESCCEVGPGRVLRGLMKRIARKFPCQSVGA